MKFLDKRLKILAAIVTLIVVALISRLVYLQIYQGEYFSKLADGNRIRLVSTSAPRGIIYDRNGVQLVNNRPRNHTIGFVFQSYNLIPHQTVLSNVELALTISGVSGAERRRRAVEALKHSVGQ